MTYSCAIFKVFLSFCTLQFQLRVVESVTTDVQLMLSFVTGVLQGPDEPLVDAQMRKINHLIDKARVESTHEVLEIGCGWGALAIQLVRRSGCRYTGITLSQEQLDYAQALVKEARLEVCIISLLSIDFLLTLRWASKAWGFCSKLSCVLIFFLCLCMQDKITFQLVDYRNVQGFHKFNRIISWYVLDWSKCLLTISSEITERKFFLI